VNRAWPKKDTKTQGGLPGPAACEETNRVSEQVQLLFFKNFMEIIHTTENQMIKMFFIFLTAVSLVSCSSGNSDKKTDEKDNAGVFYKGKNIYETEDEYLNAYYDMNYFQYRNIILYRCLEKNDFTYFETKIADEDHLVGNQVDNEYMTLLKETIHIKNNLSFKNKELDDYFMSTYSYYDPGHPKELTPNEKNILLQIDSMLTPREEKMEIGELNDIIFGIWQKNEYSGYSGYLDTLRFSDNIMAITINEMDHSKKFAYIEGKYEITNNNIVVRPEYYDYIRGGKYILADDGGLVQDYIGEDTEKVVLSPNGIISYPIVSLSKIYDEFEDMSYYKLTLFIDRPTVYYRVKEKWEKMP
jgi:hypothetical protein